MEARAGRDRRHRLEVVPDRPVEMLTLGLRERLDRGPRSIGKLVGGEQRGQAVQSSVAAVRSAGSRSCRSGAMAPRVISVPWTLAAAVASPV